MNQSEKLEMEQFPFNPMYKSISPQMSYIEKEDKRWKQLVDQRIQYTEQSEWQKTNASALQISQRASAVLLRTTKNML
jgi:hypothetical protein